MYCVSNFVSIHRTKINKTKQTLFNDNFFDALEKAVLALLGKKNINLIKPKILKQAEHRNNMRSKTQFFLNGGWRKHIFFGF